MAIFRQGVKIGPFDIRAGISRGDLAPSAYHKTAQDVRLKQHANTENSIGRFRAMMARAEGYARQARFKVKIFPPRNLKKMAADSTVTTKTLTKREGTIETQTTTPGHPDAIAMQQLWSQMGEQLEMHCDTVSMPAHDLQTDTITTFGPSRQMVTGHGFIGTILATFYADKYLRERHFIELWQKMAVNMVNHKAGYYDDYAGGKIQIFQLGQLDGLAKPAEQAIGHYKAAGSPPTDTPTYGIEATEVYPATLAAVSYDYARSSTIVKVTVGFQFKEWHNLATDSINGMQYGSSQQTLHDVKGVDGGLLGNLPPELQRIGRNLVNQASTQLPIGRITRGKIFPPFN
jgi:hypothetical protein